MNRIYHRLSGLPFIAKSYTFKFLFIAFLGIHIPLIGLVLFVLFRPDGISAASVLLLTLLLTLAATGITLFILNGLLAPLRKSSAALQGYMAARTMPQLPTHYPDEAGRLMQDIQFTLTELNDLLEEKKDLTGLLSHDLRIPVQNVKMFATQLATGVANEDEVKEYAQIILESTQEQTQLLEEVLSILRQDHLFHTENINAQTNARTLVDEALASFEGIAASKNIRIVPEFDYTGTVAVQPELFKQVLKNLMSNAVKFSYPGSEVKVKVHRTGSITNIDVIDSGMGFEPQVAERLFDRFTKNGRKGTSGENSTGIGLYLSRKIMKHHKGDLLASSEGAGKGSTFRICLN